LNGWSLPIINQLFPLFPQEGVKENDALEMVLLDTIGRRAIKEKEQQRG
jgi:hypothetical protein